MDWLNYHHLLYFWVVAREGSLARAGEKLRLAPSTLSGQIGNLERSLGEKLFTRSGRSLALTELGRTVLRYADEIFSTGRELQDAVRGRAGGQPLRLVVGISDVVPKLVARRVLEPALRFPQSVQLVCHEDKPDRLIAGLALHELDVVLADAPVPPTLRIRSFSHLLGECGVTLFATARLAERHRRKFPASIDGAPVLLPTENTTLRRSLDAWFASRRIRPRVVGEFQDSALLKVFGQTGEGIFPAPSVIAAEVRRQYQVRSLGELPGLRERFYAITAERKLEHPVVAAVTQVARERLFG